MGALCSATAQRRAAQGSRKARQSSGWSANPASSVTSLGGLVPDSLNPEESSMSLTITEFDHVEEPLHRARGLLATITANRRRMRQVGLIR
jgi:hypothetical protein